MRSPIEADHTSVLLSLADAAETWFHSKQPTKWTYEQHLVDPEVNCVTASEQRLASAVAEWLKIGGGKR